ncbi:MAG: hypothetical protein QXO70_01330, partial [Candidatus Pacearchaeota archaeon]
MIGKFSFSKIAPFIAPIFVLVYGFAMSFFRFAYGDETLYLLETALIADCIRNFKWFGNEIVGTHGFIFKLPIAILFVLFGNSVFIATAFNVILASVSVYLCYRLFLLVTGSPKWSLAGSMMLATSYYFVLTVPTFLRDIPALLVLLLLFIAFIQHRNNWIIGFLLMLLLDAKEYLFFIVTPAYLLFCFISFLRAKNFSLASFFTTIKNIITVLCPSLVFLILMLTTPLIPLNKYIVYLTGLSPSGFSSSLDAFIAKIATHNLHKKGKNIISLEEQQSKRFKKWADDRSKRAIGYVDEAAMKALKFLVDTIPADKKILLIFYKIKPELLQVCPAERLITYFESDVFPERRFRSATISEKKKILDSLNIEGILFEPDMAKNSYFNASQMPQLLEEGILFEKIYDDPKSKITCFKRANPYEKIFEFCQKNIVNTDSKILIIDDSEDLKKFSSPQNAICFFSESFPLADFLKSKTKEEALDLLERLNIEKIIVESSAVKRANYETSFLPALLADKNIYETELSTSKFIVYAPPEKLKTKETSENISVKLDEKTKNGSTEESLTQISEDEHKLFKAIEKLENYILQNSKILIIDYNIPSGLSFVEEGKKVISYFNSEFPEKEFREIASPERAFLFLIKHNIDAIVVVPEVSRHFLYHKSKLPKILANEKYCSKLSFEDILPLKIYLINDPYREIFAMAAKELKKDENILVLDDKKDFNKYSIPQHILNYASEEFSLEEFSKITDFLEAYTYLKTRKIRRIIRNPNFDGYQLFNISLLPKIFEKENFSVKLNNINNLEVYDIRYPLDDEIAELQNTLTNDSKILLLGRVEFMSRSDPKFLVNFYAETFPIESLKANIKDIYASISLIRSFGIEYVAIDDQRVNEKEFVKTALPRILTPTYSDLFKDINQFSKIYRVKSDEEIRNTLKKEFIEFSIIEKISPSVLNSERNAILVIREKFDPDISFFSKGQRIFGLFSPQIRIKDFRNKGILENADTLESLKVGLILLFPEFTNNPLLLTSKISRLLSDNLFSEKIYDDEETKISVFSLKNPYQSISEIT